MKDKFKAFSAKARDTAAVAGKKAKIAATDAGEKAKVAAQFVGEKVGDLNGDGKVDAEDFRIAAEKAKHAASIAGGHAREFGKRLSENELAQDSAKAAAVGAAVAVPVPLIGPVAGAAMGGALGAYKHLISKSEREGAASKPILGTPENSATKDIHGELLKLGDLRDKGLLSDEEFNSLKLKLIEGVSSNAPELRR